MVISDITQRQAYSTVVKVIGLGGGGSNAITRLYENAEQDILEQIICIVGNTDSQHLQSCLAPIKIQLGPNLTKGLGAGSKPSIGTDAARESKQELEEHLQKTDILILTACLGGGTGTGAAPVIAEIAKELGILTVAIVTMPFQLEGSIRHHNATNGLEELEKHVNTLLVVHNESLLSIYRSANKNAPLQDVLYHADEVLRHGIDGITGLIYGKHKIKIDFSDIRAALIHGGRGIIGIGEASGENATTEAPQLALNSPLLGKENIKGAKELIIHVTLGKGGSMKKAKDASEYLTTQVKNEAKSANIKWGFGQQNDIPDDTIRVIVIAVGFEENLQKHQQRPKILNKPKKTYSPTNRTLQQSQNIFSNPVIKVNHAEPTNESLPEQKLPEPSLDSYTPHKVQAPKYSDTNPKVLDEEPAYLRRQKITES